MPDRKVTRDVALEVWSRSDEGLAPKAIRTSVSLRTVSRLCYVRRGFEQGTLVGALATTTRWSVDLVREVEGWFEAYTFSRLPSTRAQGGQPQMEAPAHTSGGPSSAGRPSPGNLASPTRGRQDGSAGGQSNADAAVRPVSVAEEADRAEHLRELAEFGRRLRDRAGVPLPRAVIGASLPAPVTPDQPFPRTTVVSLIAQDVADDEQWPLFCRHAAATGSLALLDAAGKEFPGYIKQCEAVFAGIVASLAHANVGSADVCLRLAPEVLLGKWNGLTGLAKVQDIRVTPAAKGWEVSLFSAFFSFTTRDEANAFADLVIRLYEHFPPVEGWDELRDRHRQLLEHVEAFRAALSPGSRLRKLLRAGTCELCRPDP